MRDYQLLHADGADKGGGADSDAETAREGATPEKRGAATSGDEEDEESAQERESEISGHEIYGGGPKLYKDGKAYYREAIRKQVNNEWSSYLENVTGSLEVGVEEVMQIFQESQYKMRIYGVPLDKQKGIPKVEDQRELAVHNAGPDAVARAIQVKIFATDILEQIEG